jgi:hypothetical protein
MSSTLRAAALVSVVMFTVPAHALGQDGGSVTGFEVRVIDGNGAQVPGVRVAVDGEVCVPPERPTDPDGIAVFNCVQGGPYLIRATWS